MLSCLVRIKERNGICPFFSTIRKKRIRSQICFRKKNTPPAKSSSRPSFGKYLIPVHGRVDRRRPKGERDTFLSCVAPPQNPTLLFLLARKSLNKCLFLSLSRDLQPSTQKEEENGAPGELALVTRPPFHTLRTVLLAHIWTWGGLEEALHCPPK